MTKKNNNTLKKIVQSITKYYKMRYKDVVKNDPHFKTSAKDCGLFLLSGYQYLGLSSQPQDNFNPIMLLRYYKTAKKINNVLSTHIRPFFFIMIKPFFFCFGIVYLRSLENATNKYSIIAIYAIKWMDKSHKLYYAIIIVNMYIGDGQKLGHVNNTARFCK